MIFLASTCFSNSIFLHDRFVAIITSEVTNDVFFFLWIFNPLAFFTWNAHNSHLKGSQSSSVSLKFPNSSDLMLFNSVVSSLRSLVSSLRVTSSLQIFSSFYRSSWLRTWSLTWTSDREGSLEKLSSECSTEQMSPKWLLQQNISALCWVPKITTFSITIKCLTLSILMFKIAISTNLQWDNLLNWEVFIASFFISDLKQVWTADEVTSQLRSCTE